MIGKLQLWILIVGLVSYVARFFYPDFPLDEQQLLAGVLFLLGLIGVYPSVRAAINPAVQYTWADLFKSLVFWELVAGIIGFVLRELRPDFPYNNAVILAVIVYLLRLVDINPQVSYVEYLLETEDDDMPF